MSTPDDKDLRMDGYYIGFGKTGVHEVDRILSAIAHAGKGYHHTDGWTEETKDYGGFTGGSYNQWIQNEANKVAALITVERAAAASREQALQGALNADAERLAAAAARVGIIAGCDAPEQMADRIDELQTEVDRLRDEQQATGNIPLRHRRAFESLIEAASLKGVREGFMAARTAKPVPRGWHFFPSRASDRDRAALGAFLASRAQEPKP